MSFGPPRSGATIEELPSDDEVETKNSHLPELEKKIIDDAETSDDVSDSDDEAQRDEDPMPATQKAPKSNAIIDGPSIKKKHEFSAEELAEILSAAEALKAEGNNHYNAGEHELALVKYTDAVKLLPADHEMTAVLLGNRSAALLSLQQWERVIQDTTGAITINPRHMKAHVRRAQAYEKEKKYANALDDWKKAAELDPSLASAQDALRRLPPLVQEQQEKEKEEMMGQLKDLDGKGSLYGLLQG